MEKEAKTACLWTADTWIQAGTHISLLAFCVRMAEGSVEGKG